MAVIIAFVTYETPWFRCGGIAPVMARLPKAVCDASANPTIVLTPFHQSDHDNNRIPSLKPVKVVTFAIHYRQAKVKVNLARYIDENISWFFLRPGTVIDEPPFFDGRQHPYDVPRKILVRDSLFFGQAVVHALEYIAAMRVQDRMLKTIAKKREKKQIVNSADEEIEIVEWRLLLQDWQAATTALAFADQSVQRGKLFLTLHNSYDDYSAPDEAGEKADTVERPGLFRFGIKPGPSSDRHSTILQRALPIVADPLFTVSEEFALEFTGDLLQKEVAVKHLQRALRKKHILGIDNGSFSQLSIPSELINKAMLGKFQSVQQWKQQHRTRALQEIARSLPQSVICWGDQKKFEQKDSTWFVMAGRDDPRQKGYDLAVAAIEEYLHVNHGKSGCAQFLFYPIPGDEGEKGLFFLQELTMRYPEEVIAFVGLWKEGYSAALKGATFGLMPSLYEPFGMANDFYLDGGCVGIGRATGGTIQQIVPLRGCATFGDAVRLRANRYHSLSAHPTGILFRERDHIPSAAHDWFAMYAGQYAQNSGSSSRLDERKKYPLYQAMARELLLAIKEGIRIYHTEPELYYRMLAEGVGHIRRTFSWQRAGQEYARYIL